MPEFTSVMARSPVEASRTSTMRSTPPSPPRTMRPKSVPMASVRSKVRTVAAAPASACAARSAWRLAGIGQRMVGVEHEHVAVEALERSARRADGVAGPERPLLRHRLDPGREPLADRLGAGGHDNEHPVGLRLEAPGDRPVDQRAPAGSRAAPSASRSACGCPDRRRGEHRRVESRESCGGVGGRCWELGRLDSNQGSRDQNPLPYHLATPHRARSLGAHRVYVRRGSGRLRTEAGTARRTLGTLRGGRSRCGTRPRAP